MTQQAAKTDVRYSGSDWHRSDWLALRTLILLRWTAMVGQAVAIVVALYYLKFDLPIGLCLMTISAAIIANLILTNVFPRNKRLNETQSQFLLLFDTLQLAVLLFLTGGLANPFSLLIWRLL